MALCAAIPCAAHGAGALIAHVPYPLAVYVVIPRDFVGYTAGIKGGTVIAVVGSFDAAGNFVTDQDRALRVDHILSELFSTR
mgnify:CR=1 FL=1